MTHLKDRLLGELIGLARATDGSEHLITPETTAAVRSCLAASPENEAELAEQLQTVERCKRAMVPDCFLCANPCGRTSAFDLRELAREPNDVRAAKERIITALCGRPAQIPEPLVYRGLIALGIEDLDAAFLNELADELST